MKSVKPGRGPSLMSAVIGVAVALFGVFWLIEAVSLGATVMVPFGIIFIIIAVVQVIYNIVNGVGKRRYSEFDITDENEEPDPLNERFGGYARADKPADKPAEGGRYCPYCGAEAQSDFEFCNKCGRKLP